MKKIVFIMVIVLLIFTPTMSRGYSENRYYSTRYNISEQPAGAVYYRSDGWGFTHAFQQYKVARWYNSYGGTNVYRWSNGRWCRTWSSGYYYYFEWSYYTRQLW